MRQPDDMTEDNEYPPEVPFDLDGGKHYWFQGVFEGGVYDGARFAIEAPMGVANVRGILMTMIIGGHEGIDDGLAWHPYSLEERMDDGGAIRTRFVAREVRDEPPPHHDGPPEADS